MELNLGLGSGYDSIDKQRKDQDHDVDDGKQIFTLTQRGKMAVVFIKNYSK